VPRSRARPGRCRWLQVRLARGAETSTPPLRHRHGGHLAFEIYGRLGALRFHLMDPNWLYWYDARRPGGPRGGERGWTRLETVQHYPGAASPPGRSPLGWARTHAENQFAFLLAIYEGQVPRPNAVDGLRTQLILDADYASANQVLGYFPRLIPRRPARHNQTTRDRCSTSAPAHHFWHSI
jgi:hypothetical protein